MIRLADLPSPDTVQSSIRTEMLIGAGGNASVYYLDGDSRYVIKAFNGWHKPDRPFGEIEITDDPKFEGRNFGQSVADYGGGVHLLLLQPGKPCGHGHADKNNPERQQKCDAHYEHQLHAASQLPLSSYVELMQDMMFLNDRALAIDCSKAANLLIDEEAQKFRPVDITPISREGMRNHPGDLVIMMMDNSYYRQYKGDQDETLTEDRRMILEKIITAAEKLGISFGNIGLRENPSLSYSLTQAGYTGEEERADIEARMRAVDSAAGTAGTAPAKLPKQTM